MSIKVGDRFVDEDPRMAGRVIEVVYVPDEGASDHRVLVKNARTNRQTWICPNRLKPAGRRGYRRLEPSQ